jgi:hypothetical protein
LRNNWTTTETRFPFWRVIDLKGTSLTMTPGYQTSLYQPGTETINKHIGSSNWRKGKWQGSPGSTYWGKPYLSQKCMLPQHRGKKMS